MGWYDGITNFIGEQIIYRGMKAVGWDDEQVVAATTAIIENESLQRSTEISHKILKGDIHSVAAVGELVGEAAHNAYTETTGDKTMKKVFGTKTGDVSGEDSVITELMNNSAEAGNVIITDPSRASYIATRSLVEKGPGSVLAIPGDLLDLGNMIFNGVTGLGYNGSAGDWVRNKSLANVHWLESLAGIKPMELNGKGENFISGVYGEIVGNAVALMSGGATAASKVTLVTKPATALNKAWNVAGVVMKPVGLGMDTLSMAAAGQVEVDKLPEEAASETVLVAQETEMTAVSETASAAPARNLSNQFNEKAQDSMWTHVFNIIAEFGTWIKDAAIHVTATLGLTETFNKFAAADPDAPSSAVALSKRLNLVAPSPSQNAWNGPTLGMV